LILVRKKVGGEKRIWFSIHQTFTILLYHYFLLVTTIISNKKNVLQLVLKRSNVEVLIFISPSQGVAVTLFLIFSRPPRLVKDVHSLDNLMDPLVKSVTENGVGGGYNGLISSALTCPVPPERPPGMDGIIACSSYKNRLGTWNRKESELVIGSHIGNSYADETRGLLGWPSRIW